MSEHVATAVATAEIAAGQAPETGPNGGPAAEPEVAIQPEVTVQDVLVEEVSIDGMCGVY